MFAIIELDDSDDERPQPAEPANLSSLNSSMNVDESKTASESETKHNTASVQSLNTSLQYPISGNYDNTNVEAPQRKSSSTNSQTRGRHHRRKSTHHMVRSSDMEFATLPKELSEDDFDLSLQSAEVCVKDRTNKLSKITPNILTRQLTPEENEKKTMTVVEEIAMERLRINTLLKLNGMPEINFALYAQADVLKFQLEDRFKQRKIRQQTEMN